VPVPTATPPTPPHDPALARSVAVRVVRILREAGFVAYFAGGCVRDELLGIHPTDFDVATDATPDRVKALFPRSNMVGAAFGVVLVHWTTPHPGQPERITVEVATFRGEGAYSDRRRPDSVHFTDAQQDALRRDFTINALFLDPLAQPDAATPPGIDGRVIDFVGGLPDLRARILRAVGDPHARLNEDHLRALRAARFAARLDCHIDPATADAIRTHARELQGVSHERIGDELRRMLRQPARARAVHWLQTLGLDAPALQGPALTVDTPILAALPPATDAITALAAWSLDRAATALTSETAIVAHAQDLRKALCLSNQETVDLRDTLSNILHLRGPWLGSSVARQKRAANRPCFFTSLEILKTLDPARLESVRARLRELRIEPAQGGPAPEPLVTGDDLVHLGFKPGPSFKEMLNQLYDAQLEGRIATKPEGLELARNLRV